MTCVGTCGFSWWSHDQPEGFLLGSIFGSHTRYWTFSPHTVFLFPSGLFDQHCLFGCWDFNVTFYTFSYIHDRNGFGMVLITKVSSLLHNVTPYTVIYFQFTSLVCFWIVWNNWNAQSKPTHILGDLLRWHDNPFSHCATLWLGLRVFWYGLG